METEKFWIHQKIGEKKEILPFEWIFYTFKNWKWSFKNDIKIFPIETSKIQKIAKKFYNKWRDIKIKKVVINCCVGESSDRLTNAARVLDNLARQTPVFSKSKLTIRSWGIRRNEKIACHYTLRGKKAYILLERGLKAKGFELNHKNFSDTGNFGFGINEHIDLGVNFDTSTGIFGMDFFIVLGRAGERNLKRKRRRSKIGKTHKIKKTDALWWFQKFYGDVIGTFD
ncbi:rpl11B (nucleomorph) [Hemiselmis andersenii]|uniref:Rpl11B n=1 Tax=Hemiselmis andersenii TaxID=464988 RepID=A9BKC3_HEMAN|nr:rpl11B [Hemiselmis andersenii]ABW97956.1 rpl11B [Hemiselmis andersenii]|mmetsp:Transcript_7861/g.18147  ORF Transcript_7861/g.18147 Transcript_7861/m.18147 type:complete len:227 (+) Transcript_7861:28-708(+)